MLYIPQLLLLLAFSFIEACAWVSSHEFSDNDLRSGCRFMLEGKTYDVCPLIEAPVVVSADDSGQKMGVEYTFTLGGYNDGTEQMTRCPEGTWVCKKELPHGLNAPANYVPIAGKLRPSSALVDQGTNAIASISTNTSMDLFLVGGYVDERPQYALVTFTCEAIASEVNGLVFTGFNEELGVHSFSWTTKHACPVGPPPPNFGVTGENSDVHEEPELPTPEDSERIGEELVDTNGASAARRRAAFIIFAVVTFFIVIAALLSSSTLRWKAIYILGAFSKRIALPLSFYDLRKRVSPSRLVRWAQEDMPLNNEEEISLDTYGDFVESGWSWDGEMGLDEYIPLKLSKQPKHDNKRGSIRKGRNRDYGTTFSAEAH